MKLKETDFFKKKNKKKLTNNTVIISNRHININQAFPV